MIKRRDALKASILGLAGMSVAGMAASRQEPGDYNILGLGGIPDGRTLNTRVIQQAVDACSAQGGGTVRFPPGKYLTGALLLKSGVELFLAKGAHLLGSINEDDYFLEEASAGEQTAGRRFSLINAFDQQDIAIRGEGTIDGQGNVFPHRTPEGRRKFRPNVVNFRNCENVRIEGVFMTNSGSWMQHYSACRNLRIRGIRVYNHCNHNNDGIDIDGCRDVVVSDCIVDSDDDAICLKSTGRSLCENILVTNCLVRSFCNALKLGTESIGGFRNVIIANCTVTPCEPQKRYYGYELGESAISVEMVDGGILEQVTIDNITIMDTGCPIFIRLGNRGRKPSPNDPAPGVGVLRNVRISNIMATTTSIVASSITGIAGHHAENIHLDNITLNIQNKGDGAFADKEVPENDAGYPTARMYGEQLPAAAFYIRHARNLRFSNVHLMAGKENFLPLFVMDDVKNARLLFPEIETVNDNALVRKSPDCRDITVLGINPG